jgi:hypothetical protein
LTFLAATAPALVAVCSVLLAATLHPLGPSRLHLPPAATAALALFTVVGLLARGQGIGPRLVGLGALTVACAVGYDGLRGHRGTLSVEPGQGAQRFEEEGPEGRSLGLRPLGFDVVLERLEADGRARLRTGDGATLEVAPARAASFGGLRLGVAGRETAAEAPELRIAVAGPAGEPRTIVLHAGEAAAVDGLQVSLERYFPDFALDKDQQPYSRSAEPRNPAALLRVTRGTEGWRVFVIRAMPGIHRPAGLDQVLSLTDVGSRAAVRLRVSREPAAALAFAGALLVAAGLAWPARPA